MSTKTDYLQIRIKPQTKMMIQQAAHRAGLDMSSWVLARLFPPAQQQWQQLLTQLNDTPNQQRLALAELNDWLTQLPARDWTSALQHWPTLSLSEHLSNYIAAMVETAAHQKQVAPPDWTLTIKPLTTPHFGSELMGLRLHLLVHAPPAFRRRNIFIDATVGDRV